MSACESAPLQNLTDSSRIVQTLTFYEVDRAPWRRADERKRAHELRPSRVPVGHARRLAGRVRFWLDA
jgi:hypothetical protein